MIWATPILVALEVKFLHHIWTISLNQAITTPELVDGLSYVDARRLLAEYSEHAFNELRTTR